MARSRRGKNGTKKYGRMARKPAHKKYNAEKRWIKNKEKRLKKELKRQERLKARKPLQNPWTPKWYNCKR